MKSNTIPLYRDWSFWAVIIALVALILSQLPPIHLLVKGAAVELEVYPKLSLTHKVGNPNLQLHVQVSNTGGKKIRVRQINAAIQRDGKELTILPTQNYVVDQINQSTALFTGFSLAPNEEWGNIINLLELFDRETEVTYRKLESEMMADYRKKAGKISENVKDLIEINKEYVEPFDKFFEERFIWLPGEYFIIVNVVTDDESANTVSKYRFTVFESHSSQLRAVSKMFKYGAGIWWNPTDIPLSVVIDMKKA